MNNRQYISFAVKSHLIYATRPKDEAKNCLSTILTLIYIANFHVYKILALHNI